MSGNDSQLVISAAAATFAFFLCVQDRKKRQTTTSRDSSSNSSSKKEEDLYSSININACVDRHLSCSFAGGNEYSYHTAASVNLIKIIRMTIRFKKFYSLALFRCRFRHHSSASICNRTISVCVCASADASSISKTKQYYKRV